MRAAVARWDVRLLLGLAEEELEEADGWLMAEGSEIE